MCVFLCYWETFYPFLSILFFKLKKMRTFVSLWREKQNKLTKKKN